MAAADVRDMLDLPADGQQPRPAKKQKLVEKRPDGITRELYSLLGPRAPPISLNENKYKGRRKWMSKVKVKPWEMASFTNPARSDDLVLSHWQKKRAPTNLIPSGEPGDEDNIEKKEGDTSVGKDEDVYPFAKYNIKAQHPRRYTDDEYEKLLKSDIWTREETDYLMDLVEEYDLRWVVIADRYEYPPGGSNPDAGNTSTALAAPSKRRTMEAMKSRYYNIAAHMLAIEHPPSEMSEAEFELHEKMMKFNSERERMRKELASIQLNRTKEEVHEEALLLEELKRIVAHEKQFTEERKELYARLEAPISAGNTTMYQSSQGLSQLLQTLLQADKNKKRRPLLGPETGASTPESQGGPQAGPSGTRESRQETPAATPATTSQQPATKKSAAAANANASQPTIKTLTPSEEAKYGVTHHDRLTSGVQFRNEKAQKLTQAKSNVQSQKLAAALTELEIPPRLFMPTEKVCKEFEKLIHSVNLLLDARKVSEKIEGEIRVLEASKQERERKEREMRGETTANENDESSAVAANTKVEEETSTGLDKNAGKQARVGVKATPERAETGLEVAGSGDGGASAAEASPRKLAANKAHKRSASVLSTVSDKSTKKQKK